MDDKSGLRKARRWRLLLAHDATASTCNPILDAIEGALGNVEVSESSSIYDARLAVLGSHDDGWRSEPRFHVAMVCLDLPPAPLGGVRLAQELLEAGLPVVLITRSLRWIPPSATSLLQLPWVSPDATPAEVSRAIGEAMAMAPVLPERAGSRHPRDSEVPLRLVSGE